MLHYIFILSYLIFADLIDFLFNHVSSAKKHCTEQKMKFSIKDFFSKCVNKSAGNCCLLAYILNKNLNANGQSEITVTFALFNQSEEYKSSRKKGVLENKDNIQKANIQKGYIKKQQQQQQKPQKFRINCKTNNAHN